MHSSMAHRLYMYSIAIKNSFPLPQKPLFVQRLFFFDFIATADYINIP
jgi:hypothetical protein